jgi:hypothetical protein
MDFAQMMVGLYDAIETAKVTEEAKSVESPAIPESFNQTEKVLVTMMRDNTGASILDSGGAYGRAWQRALKEDFGKRERATVEGRVSRYNGKTELCLDVSIDLFSYLAEKLTYDRAMTRQFEKFSKLPENENDHWLGLMRAFPEWIADKRDARLGEHSGVENSYNHDCYLSGTIQFAFFELNHEAYCLLQIHGGCDVRGGYTGPIAFTCEDNYSLFDWYRATISPDRREVRKAREAMKAELGRQTFLLQSDEAAAHAAVDSFGEDVYWDVGSYDEHGSGCDMKLDEYPVLEIETRAEWKRGSVCVLPDDRVLCPVTGAVLCASF